MTPKKSLNAARRGGAGRPGSELVGAPGAWQGVCPWDAIAVGNPCLAGMDPGGPPDRSVYEIIAERSAQFRNITGLPMGFVCTPEQGYDS